MKNPAQTFWKHYVGVMALFVQAVAFKLQSIMHHTDASFAPSVDIKLPLPLGLWFAARLYLTNQKNGVSATGLHRVLGIG